MQADAVQELGLSNKGQLELLRGAVERGACLRIRVRGGSMRPFIRDDDVLTVAPLSDRPPAPGDVVAFVMPGSDRLAIHRIIASTRGGLRMRGDNSTRDDGIVTPGAVLGRVVRVERAGKDIRLGLGAERGIIARLSRCGLFGLAGALVSLPRDTAAACARGLQGRTLYRAIASRLRSGVAVAEAGADDLAVVQRLFSLGGLTGRRDPAVTNFVAMRGRTVLGFVQYVHRTGMDDPWAGHWVFSLVVRGPWRGMGIGGLLVMRVVEQAVAEGAGELFTAVYPDNHRARALYGKHGFEPTSLPALEPLFEAEERTIGRRRIVMRRPLTTERMNLRDTDG